MKKIVYKKLLLQAEEARDRGFDKLASGILKAISSEPEDLEVEYSASDLQKDVYDQLWALVNNVIEHHDIESVDSEKLDSVIEQLSIDVIEQLESALGVNLEDSE